MVNISLDKSRLVRLHARVREASVPRVFTFLNEDGTDHNIEDYDFELIVFKRMNSTAELFKLTVGDGLTASGNQLTIAITAARATVPANTYYWRLRSADEDHTWLNGPFEFHMGEFDNLEEEETIDIYQNG